MYRVWTFVIPTMTAEKNRPIPIYRPDGQLTISSVSLVSTLASAVSVLQCTYDDAIAGGLR